MFRIFFFFACMYIFMYLLNGLFIIYFKYYYIKYLYMNKGNWKGKITSLNS